MKVAPRLDEPVAVEEGVAVRGLERAAVQAVSQHRGDSGSRRQRKRESRLRDLDTRSWLAQERWPGKLVFFRRPNPWTVFPSVRLCEKQTVISRTRSTGPGMSWIDRVELAKVFARWHIPYETVAAAEPRKEPGP